MGGGPHIIAMAIRKIARMGHPVLLKPAEWIDDPTAPEIQHLVDDMLETLIDANGAGLAAPQVYEPLRLVLFQAPGERSVDPGLSEEEAFDHTAPLTVLINPVITPQSDEMEKGWEGCLSIPGMRGLVPRHTDIIYKGTTVDGEVLERRARGFHARVVQHECDHLEGILYPERMDDLSELIFETEAVHWMKK
jgi:peptide deformylase